MMMTGTGVDVAIAQSTELNAKDIAERLEEEIVFGYLHARERLIEDELCARFHVTRHVVRQALTELQAMGLIERRRNIGAFVKFLTDKEVMDLYVVRDVLEVSAARQIDFPVSKSRLDALTDIQRRHDHAAESGDLRAAFHANIVFHQALFALTDNPVLAGAIEDFARRTHAIRFLSMTDPHFLQKARNDHWKMINALQNEDRDSLISLCRDHLLPSRDAYLAQSRRRGGLVSAKVNIL